MILTFNCDQSTQFRPGEASTESRKKNNKPQQHVKVNIQGLLLATKK